MWSRLLAVACWAVCIIPVQAAENRFDFAGHVVSSPYIEPGTETLMIMVLDAEAPNESENPIDSYVTTSVWVRGFEGYAEGQLAIRRMSANALSVEWSHEEYGVTKRLYAEFDLAVPEYPAQSVLLNISESDWIEQGRWSASYFDFEYLVSDVGRFRSYPDHDLDGIKWDNCEYLYNPDQRDDDWDGIGNACDADFTYQDPGELNTMCVVDLQDLRRLYLTFLDSDDLADMTRDGIVNFADLAIFMSQLFVDYRDPGRNPSGRPNECSPNWSPWNF